MVDVLVIGGGNAALCAALMAREAGASVLLLEAAPREWRGGNSQHTRNLRCMHDAPQDVLIDAYPEEEYWQDLLKVTGGLTDEKLARLAIRESATCRDWMRRHGVHFQPPLSGALHVARTNAFFMGGGKALVNAYFRSAEALGVAGSLRRTRSMRIELDGDRFVAARIGNERIEARSCVLACGGFESNREWLREAWGQINGEWVARQFPDSRHALQHGRAAQVHDRCRRGLHRRSVPVALRGHRRARAALRRRHLHAHRLRVAGHRGESRRRALLRRRRGFLAQALCDLGASGRAAAGPDRLFDHRLQSRSAASCRRCFQARRRTRSGELARAIGLDEAHLRADHRDLQRRLPRRARSTTRCSTTATPRALRPPRPTGRSRIDKPPFYAYALRPGITFTYLGPEGRTSTPPCISAASRAPTFSWRAR